MPEKKSTRIATTCLAAALILLLPVAALGDDDDDDSSREQYEAQQALRSGKIRPLDEIIAAVRKEIPGDIIEIEFENDDGRYIYEMDIIQPSGQLIEIEIDATTKVILGREES